VDTGLEVQVHPIPPGREVLLYPGGEYMRVVPNLRQPGETPGPIHLHMPARHSRTASVAPSAPVAASLFGSLSTSPTTPPVGAQTASAAPPPASSAPGTEGLAKQGVILFAHDAAAPADSALDSIRLLAGQLNNGMSRTQSRVELMAYGGNKGDKGSDARRLSLKRALAIRQVLIDAGVNSARIDVHAQGGVDDTGPTDRVDVYIRS
jgi:outer membrane protein OmpA-like peptidoglycan-associated protein